MNTNDIVNGLADKFGLTKTQAKEILESALEAIFKGVQSGERVQLHNFGTFQSREMGEKKARNPRTGEAVVVPPSRKFAFHPARYIKDRMMSEEGALDTALDA